MTTLSHAIIGSEIFASCLSHALSTEHQEIMGLLLGSYHSTSRFDDGYDRSNENNENNDINDDNNDNGSSVLMIHRMMVLTRNTKQRDRVEVNADHLALASTVAETISTIDDTRVSIVGWYHSHPHITVFPSHVDCRTQGLYQSLDIRFIGLIFSVFNASKFDVCAFQSRNQGSIASPNWVRAEIPVFVIEYPQYPLRTDSLQISLATKTLAKSHIRRLRSYEHLLNLNYMLLNEERLGFDKVISNFAAYSKTFQEKFGLQSTALRGLDIIHISHVYEAQLTKLLEIQLLPLLSVMENILASRIVKRKSLLEKIARFEASIAKDTAAVANDPTAIEMKVDDVGAAESRHSLFEDKYAEVSTQIKKTMQALRITGPQWFESCVALKMMLRGLRVRQFSATPQHMAPSCTDDNITLRLHAAESHVVSQRKPGLMIGNTSDRNSYFVRTRVRLSPWSLILEQSSLLSTTYILLNVTYNEREPTTVQFTVVDSKADIVSSQEIFKLKVVLRENPDDCRCLRGLQNALRLNLWN